MWFILRPKRIWWPFKPEHLAKLVGSQRWYWFTHLMVRQLLFNFHLFSSVVCDFVYNLCTPTPQNISKSSNFQIGCQHDFIAILCFVLHISRLSNKQQNRVVIVMKSKTLNITLCSFYQPLITLYKHIDVHACIIVWKANNCGKRVLPWIDSNFSHWNDWTNSITTKFLWFRGVHTAERFCYQVERNIMTVFRHNRKNTL